MCNRRCHAVSFPLIYTQKYFSVLFCFNKRNKISSRCLVNFRRRCCLSELKQRRDDNVIFKFILRLTEPEREFAKSNKMLLFHNLCAQKWQSKIMRLRGCSEKTSRQEFHCMRVELTLLCDVYERLNLKLLLTTEFWFCLLIWWNWSWSK